MTFNPQTAQALSDVIGPVAAQALSLAEPLQVADPVFEASQFSFPGTAVSATFVGSNTGHLSLLLGAELPALLANADRPVDLAAALNDSVLAILGALDQQLGSAPIETSAEDAVDAAFTDNDAFILPLVNSTGDVRAAVVFGLSATTTDTDAPTGAPVSGDVAVQRLDLLRGVEMAARVVLGEATMTVDELLALRSGAIVELDRAAGAPADLYVNGRLLGRGEVVVVDENYGLRITEVVSDDNSR